MSEERTFKKGDFSYSFNVMAKVIILNSARELPAVASSGMYDQEEWLLPIIPSSEKILTTLDVTILYTSKFNNFAPIDRTKANKVLLSRVKQMLAEHNSATPKGEDRLSLNHVARIDIINITRI